MQNKDIHNENYCKVYKPEIIDLTQESPTPFLRETKSLPPSSRLSIESEPEVTIMQEFNNLNNLPIQSQQEIFKMELLAHQKTFNQNKKKDSSSLSYLIDPILINFNNNKSSSSIHSIEEDSMELTFMNTEDTLKKKLINNRSQESNSYNLDLIHKEDSQSSHHGISYQK
ncbi:hypothetical protein O181_077713 [Austropuccinia psidii MF-1]|uniref:Uncharacterized protein n=1 Tax=Austropuccinia psidii MF-1 TaxID=1389203 RepID=A0A9Q3IDZ2_9BASI|nr:hypothetical protein [Austropuccinia psidii MF-1]